MVEIQEREGGSVVALMEVDPAQVHLYGCAAADATVDSDVVRVTGLVEKPEPADAPSNLAVIGRYVLTRPSSTYCDHTEPGRGGEIQLTDALQLLAQDEKIGGPVHGVVFKGRRYDTGDRSDYLRAIVRLACEREDLGPDFRTWLRKYVTEEM